MLWLFFPWSSILFIVKRVVVVAQSRPTLVTPWTAALQVSLFFPVSPSWLKCVSIDSVMPSSHLIFRLPLLLLPSVFPSLRVFSSESALRARWPKDWSISFSNSSSSWFRVDFYSSCRYTPLLLATASVKSRPAAFQAQLWRPLIVKFMCLTPGACPHSAVLPTAGALCKRRVMLCAKWPRKKLLQGNLMPNMVRSYCKRSSVRIWTMTLFLAESLRGSLNSNSDVWL